MIGYGDTVRVMSQVFQDVFRAAEGWFDLDHPAVVIRFTQECTECFVFSQVLHFAGQRQFVIAEHLFECVRELAAEYIGKHAAGKKEAIAGLNPFGMVRR